MSTNLNTLLQTLQKEAGLESLNPPTSHESGGTPDDVAAADTGAFFAEQEAETVKRPGPTPEDNPVKSENATSPTQQPVDTKLPGDDPAEERDVTGTVQDKNDTSHPASGSYGDKYASADMLKQAQISIASIVDRGSKRLAELAATSKTAGAKPKAPETAGTKPTVDPEVEKYAKSIEDQGGTTELANYYRGFGSIAEIQEIYDQTKQAIYDVRQVAEKQANHLANIYDQEKAKAAAEKKAAAAAKQTTRRSTSKTAAATIYSQLATLLAKRAEGEEPEEEEEAEPAAAPPAEEAAAAPVEDPAMVDPAAGGMVDPASMGADPGMTDPSMADPSMGADPGMGGAEAISPELIAALQQLADQNGVSVEELIMAMVGKQASAAIQNRDKRLTPNAALSALAKEALNAAGDVLQRGGRK